MARALYIFSFLMISHFSSFSQSSVNDYKYIVIPSQFEFLNQRDQYQVNSLTKFLFNKYGYTAYLQDEELPEDLHNNRCLGLTANVVKDNAFLKTKLHIELKDCNNNVIMTSQTGETREKEYSMAYNLALRNAFETFQNMEYAYQPNPSILSKAKPETIVSSNAKEQEEIEKLKQEIKSLKEDQPEAVALEKPMEILKVGEEPMKVNIPKEATQPMEMSKKVTSEVLYAQGIANGFQLVDQTPKVVMILLSTGAKDVYAVKDKNAIVYKKESQWIYSENDGNNVNEKVINIKF
ncbi:MAG: hypothetical protein ABIO60_07985 [Aquaticitalea sp.]